MGKRSGHSGHRDEAGSRVSIDQVDDESKLQATLESDRAVLFKHSPVCSVSFVAMKEIQRFAETHPGVSIFVVDVRAHEPLSQLAAIRLGVEYESPQAIVIRNGTAAWRASHFEITAESLSQAVFGR
jgi:bacillithiol system protein YtxJ